jgi:pyruvate dehydrogenase E2 component (dihydrolipoamide acetyltransferase)
MFEFQLPDLGEGVAEGEVLAWHVAVGDRVTEDDVLAEVETDKAAVDVPSPVDGVVHELHAEVGDVLATGEVLVSIEEGAEDGAEEAAEPADEAATGEETAADERVFAPPSARRLARETGVDIAAVEGSGPGGRVTEADVEAAAADGPTSVVSRVDRSDEDDGPTSVVSKVSEDTGDGDEQAVTSAVRRATTAPMAERRERTLATPATRRLARDLGVDIDAVPTDETRDGEPYVDAAAVRAVAEREGGPAATASAQVGAEIPDEDVRVVT